MENIIPKFEVKYFDNHTYKVNGKKVYSVTQVLDAINKPALNKWRESHSQEFIDKTKLQATTVGDLVHKAAEAYNKGTVIDLAVPTELIDQYQNGVDAFGKWWTRNNIIPVATEANVGSIFHNFAGRTDLIGFIENLGYGIVDYKTLKTIDDDGNQKSKIIYPEDGGYIETYPVYLENYTQVNAYRIAAQETYGIKINWQIVARFGKEDGICYPVKIPIDDDCFNYVFLSALKIKEYQKFYEKKMKGKNNGKFRINNAKTGIETDTTGNEGYNTESNGLPVGF